MRIHTGETYLFDICGKCFHHASQFKHHSIAHSGEKPFVCSICDNSLSRAPNLQDHMRVHTNEPVHEISKNVLCATSEVSDQPAHTRSLIRTFASRLCIL